MLAELDSRIPVALEACGLEAERLAKQLCPVDTGRLRNSITHIIGGESKTHSYTDTSGEKYSDEIDAGGKNADTVFVGTCVEYAPYVEAGHSLPSGKTAPSRPFLAPALSENTDKYKAIITAYLQGNK